MNEKPISIGGVSKVIALIGSIIGAWLFLTSNFVNAADYRQDSLAMQATFIALQLDINESRLARETDEEKREELKRWRDNLDRQQQMIMERQLDN